MKVKQIGLALVGALMAVGCTRDDGPFLAPQVALAYTRFINAIPDTVSVDFRYVDQLEYSPFWLQLAYRGFTPYQGTAPGARHLRVFTNPGGDSIYIRHVTNVLIDQTPTFQANKYYTLVAVGFSRTGQTPTLQLQVIEDAIPGDIGSNVAYRVVNLGSGLGGVDVGVTAAGTDAVGTPVFPNVAFGGTSAYQSRAPGNAWFRITTPGTSTELVTGNGRQAPNGVIGDPALNLTTIGGASQAGSAYTAFVFPRSVSGSLATGVTTPTVVFVVDKHPR